MASQAVDLHRLMHAGLLAAGQAGLRVRGAALEASPWSLAALAGRYVELCGEGAAAVSTVAARLVRDAQRAQEPVAWVTDPRVAVYPPDLAQLGVDLGALAVVRVEELRAMLRAADSLLRSGAFGLTVVDLRPHGDGGRGLGGAPVPMAAQVRLAGLAKQHEATLLLLPPQRAARGPSAAGGQGSLASLRVRSRRVRLAAGSGERGDRLARDGGGGSDHRGARFRCVLQAVKDKRRGGIWECEQVLRGPMGLR